MRYTGVSTRCSNSAVMSLRAQEFRSLMACGMKLSLSLVVWYRLPDGSRQNSLFRVFDDPLGLLSTLLGAKFLQVWQLCAV